RSRTARSGDPDPCHRHTDDCRQRGGMAAGVARVADRSGGGTQGAIGSRHATTGQLVGSVLIPTSPHDPLPLGAGALGLLLTSLYPCRKALMGSPRLARMAGNQTATSATASNTTGTTKKVRGSHGFTPNRNPAITRVNPNAAASPHKTPAR